MSKKTLALAATIIATATLSNAANAGGLRVGLGFGFPLGNFVAREHQSDTGRSYKQHNSYSKPRAVARSHNDDAPVRKAKKAAPKPAPKVEVAEAPARKVKRVAPKVEVAEAPRSRKIVKLPKVSKPVAGPVEVQTAKLEDNVTVTDETPSIYVPESPPAAEDANFTGTQSTPAVARTAAVTIEPDPVAEPAKVEPQKAEEPKAEKTVELKSEVKSEPKADVPATVKRLCRRFSAAIAGLIDVPCE